MFASNDTTPPADTSCEDIDWQRVWMLCGCSRSMIWKQGKYGQQRYRQLRQRGVDKDLAASTAGSPHGPWRVANSPALSIALPLAYFDSLGLPRLFDGLA